MRSQKSCYKHPPSPPSANGLIRVRFNGLVSGCDSENAITQAVKCDNVRFIEMETIACRNAIPCRMRDSYCQPTRSRRRSGNLFRACSRVFLRLFPPSSVELICVHTDVVLSEHTLKRWLWSRKGRHYVRMAERIRSKTFAIRTARERTFKSPCARNRPVFAFLRVPKRVRFEIVIAFETVPRSSTRSGSCVSTRRRSFVTLTQEPFHVNTTFNRCSAG